MSIFERISIYCINTGVGLLKPLVNLYSPLLFCITLTLVMFFWIGRRLSRFNKPESLLLSPVIRNVSSVLSIYGQVMIYLSLAYLVFAFTLIEVRYVFSGIVNNEDLYDSLFLCISDLWSAYKDPFISIIFGILTGATISIITNMRLIPHWERGEGLHNIDDILAKFKTLQGFDPLPYINLKKGCFVGLHC